MFASFEPNVVIVNGETNSAIYNHNNGIVLPIEHSVRNLLFKMFYVGFDEANNLENELFNFLSDLRLIKKSIEKTGYPDFYREFEFDLKFAWVEVLKTCNLKCIHCYENSTSNDKERISKENFYQAIEFLISQNCSFIQIIGGEPLLLNDELKHFILFARSKNLTVEVFTNATLLNETWCEFFYENKVSIALSLHSDKKLYHDSVTNKSGSFEKTMNGIALLKKKKIIFRVIHTKLITNKNLDVGLKNILNIKSYLPRLAGRMDISQIDEEVFLEKAITLKKVTLPVSKFRFEQNISGHNCFRSKIYIDLNLDVYPCVMERRVSYGNLKAKENLFQKFNSKSLSKDFINECKFCEFRYSCFDCRPDSLSSNVLEKPWYCCYNPKTGIWANPVDRYKELCDLTL